MQRNVQRYPLCAPKTTLLTTAHTARLVPLVNEDIVDQRDGWNRKSTNCWQLCVRGVQATRCVSRTIGRSTYIYTPFSIQTCTNTNTDVCVVLRTVPQVRSLALYHEPYEPRTPRAAPQARSTPRVCALWPPPRGSASQFISASLRPHLRSLLHIHTQDAGKTVESI